MAPSLTTGLPRVVPIVPVIRREPFNDREWLFEPKYDGFRGLVYLSKGRCAIYSKHGNKFSRFSELEKRLCGAFLEGKRSVILDGEVVAYGTDGRVSFWHLMRGEGTLGYVAFDLLWSRGRDRRRLPLVERKKRLGGIIPVKRESCAPHSRSTSTARHCLRLLRTRSGRHRRQTNDRPI
jgi:bifunctional non-homologous end joining protein LigD